MGPTRHMETRQSRLQSIHLSSYLKQPSNQIPSRPNIYHPPNCPVYLQLATSRHFSANRPLASIAQIHTPRCPLHRERKMDMEGVLTSKQKTHYNDSK